MKSKKRAGVLILVCILLFSIICCSVYIVASSSHICHGNNCRICAHISTCETVIGGKCCMRMNTAMTLLALLCFVDLNCISVSFSFLTPVELKVRMLY